MFQVLRNENDFLKEFVGETYNRKSLNHINSFYKDRFSKYGSRNLNKFSLVTCLENARKNQEILSIGGSSLLRDKKTGIIEPNLILDNFGLFLSGMFQATSTGNRLISLTNDAGVAKNCEVFGNGGNFGNTGGTRALGHQIKMGSGNSAVARADFKIQTALVNAPESGYLDTNNGAYTAGNTVIYQADANPTGGSGSVNEIGSFAVIYDTVAISSIMIAHDLISPTVTYAINKLLRGSYTWQI